MSTLFNKADRLSPELKEALALQVMEDNPLTPDEIAMFRMFEAEGWSDEKCRAYILKQISGEAGEPLAAE